MHLTLIFERPVAATDVALIVGSQSEDVGQGFGAVDQFRPANQAPKGAA